MKSHAEHPSSLSSQPERGRPFVRLAAVSALAIGALTACAPGEEPPRSTETSTPVAPPEAPKTPEAPATDSPEAIFERKVEAYKIPDGLSTEELAEAILDRLSMWNNAGSERGDELREGRTKAKVQYEEFLRPVAEEEAKAAIAALLPDDWQEHENLVAFVDRMMEQNFNTVLRFMQTNWHERYDEGYRTGRTLEAVEEMKGGDVYRQFYIDYVQYGNQPDVGENPVRFVTNTMVVDGDVKLVHASFENR